MYRYVVITHQGKVRSKHFFKRSAKESIRQAVQPWKNSVYPKRIYKEMQKKGYWI